MSTKIIQGKLWSVAPGYWSRHFEPWFMPIYRTAFKELNLSADDVLLVAGCGAGLFTQLAGRTGAQVTGVDAASGLLEVARQRNPGVNFLEEDLESLPFADESFDVVAGFNSFQYAGSFDTALAEAARVLRAGGKLVLAIWDKPEESDATKVLQAIGSLLPPPPPGTPGPFALSEDGRMEASFSKAGLQMIFKKQVDCPFLYASLDEGVKSFMSTGPAAAALAHNSRKDVENIIGGALEPFHLIDGMHFQMNRFLVFVATK